MSMDRRWDENMSSPSLHFECESCPETIKALFLLKFKVPDRRPAHSYILRTQSTESCALWKKVSTLASTTLVVRRKSRSKDLLARLAVILVSILPSCPAPCALAARRDAAPTYPRCVNRSEERRVGKECRSRWTAYQY